MLLSSKREFPDTFLSPGGSFHPHLGDSPGPLCSIHRIIFRELEAVVRNHAILQSGSVIKGVFIYGILSEIAAYH